MDLLRFVPIKLTAFLIGGILIGRQTDFDPYVALSFVVFPLLVLGFLFIKQKNSDSLLFGICMGLTTLSLGILIFTLSQPKNHKDHYKHTDFAGQHVWHIKVREVLKSNPYSDRYEVNIQGLDSLKASGKLLLTIEKNNSPKKLQVDDELIVCSQIDQVRPPLNPYQFNYKKYLQNLGIYHRLRPRPNEYHILSDRSRTIYGTTAIIRDKITSKLKAVGFGKEELSIIRALLLGQRDDISPKTFDDYKNAGAIHILALSGLHIGIILMLLQFLLAPLERLPKGKTVKLITVVALLWAFALISGFSASIVRAITMFSFVAYALYLNRPANTFNILALSMFFMLLVVNPNLLFQVGFQMSYAAVFAIVWIYPLFQKLWFPKTWLLQKGWQLLSVSLAAQLGVLPISLFYFHQFPGLFFVSNLIIVPFLGVLLGMGILVIALALLGLLPNFLVFFYNALIHGMNTVIAWVAHQEAFIFEAISFGTQKLLFSYVLIISLVLICSQPTFKRVVAFLLGVIGLQLWVSYTTYKTSKKETFIVAHQTRNTVLLHQLGNHLNVFTTDSVSVTGMVDDYNVAEHIDHVEYKPLQYTY
ncbi:MAG: ComEC/Rec2 family competence protein, partial [Bacteroidota bacterium]